MSSFLDYTGLSRLVSKIKDSYATSITAGDTTHAPTSQAVWNRAYTNSIALSNGKAVIKLGTVSFATDSGSVIRFCVWNDGYADAGQITELYVTYRSSGTYTGIHANCISSHSYLGSTGKYNYEVYVDANGSSADVYFKITSVTTNRKTLNLIDYDNKFTPNVSELDSVPNTATEVTVVCPVKKPSNSNVGSTSQPVYVDSNGQVQPCTNGIYSFEFKERDYGDYEIADITFDSISMANYMGIQLAVNYRGVANESGSGILGMTFNDSNDTGPSGRLLVTQTRIGITQSSVNNLYFYIEKLSSTNYKLCVHTSNWQMISFSLISGSPKTFTVPSSLTHHTGSKTLKLAWSTIQISSTINPT